MHKTPLHIATVLLLAATISCQERIIERRVDGMISVHLDNSLKVEAQTRAEGTGINLDEFNVYVYSSGYSETYKYRELVNPVSVPAGMYTLSAENVTESESISLPDLWGQPRYVGVSEEKEVVAGDQATTFNIECAMVNTAVSVVFDESITGSFSGYKVTAYTDEGRKLEYDAANTVGPAPAVGYFTPKTLRYVFTGKYLNVDDGGKEYPNDFTFEKSVELTPATLLNLKFKIGDDSDGGNINIDINVNTDYDLVSETVTVNPDVTE